MATATNSIETPDSVVDTNTVSTRPSSICARATSVLAPEDGSPGFSVRVSLHTRTFADDAPRAAHFYRRCSMCTRGRGLPPLLVHLHEAVSLQRHRWVRVDPQALGHTLRLRDQPVWRLNIAGCCGKCPAGVPRAQTGARHLALTAAACTGSCSSTQMLCGVVRVMLSSRNSEFYGSFTFRDPKYRDKPPISSLTPEEIEQNDVF
ncbi:hypothetical protein GGX14DRAFT_391638 [Mycena pura]|uniref:Uncharacterized protein n=1 Tax=Mycena pura TaxID=153505 RepID=A0AAD6YIG2_9AGAR|nr:hypothetical protein GGX14DRAFT_391638 [Mycena pura]